MYSKNASKKILVVAETDFASGVGHKRRIEKVVANLSETFGSDAVELLTVFPSGLNLLKTWKNIRRLKRNPPVENVRLRFFVNITHPWVINIFSPLTALLIGIWCRVRYGKENLLLWAEMAHSAWNLRFVKKFLPVPIIVDAHGISDEALSTGSSLRRFESRYREEIRALNFSDGWVTVSNRLLEECVLRTGRRPSRTLTLANTVDEKKFSWSPSAYEANRAELGIENEFIFVYSGGTQPWQAIDAVLRMFASIQENPAFAELRPVFLFLTWDASFSIEKKLTELNIQLKNLRFLRVDPDRVPFYLQASDAAVLLRADNIVNNVSCPTKAGEYLMSGLPLIVTPNIGDVSDLVLRTRTGFMCASMDAIDADALSAWCRDVRAGRESYAKRSVDAASGVFGSHLNKAIGKMAEDLLSRKRFLLVVGSLEAGGAEKVMAFLAGALAGRGHNVTLATWDDGTTPPFYGLGPGVEHVALDIRGNSTSVVNAVGANIRRIRTLRELFYRKSPHAILSFNHTTNVSTLFAAKGLGIPVIVSERIDPRFYPEEFIWKMLRSVAYRWAAKVVVLTQHMKEFFPEKIRQKTIVIPNAVTAAPPAALKSGEPVIAALGRLEINRKGFDLLLRAFSMLEKKYPDWTVAVAGNGPDRPQLEALRDELGLSSKVRFLGEIKEPWVLLGKAAVFAMPSRVEGFPNALCEAMAAGVAVVASDCDGCRAVVRDSMNGLLFRSGDEKALAECLDRLMGNPALREKLSGQGRQILNELEPGKILDAWENLLVESVRR